MNKEPNSPCRVALGVEYDGAAFHGWQRQGDPKLPTVQGAVEQALAKIANQSIDLVCAGRTDSGVHATGQVVHFDCAIDRGIKAWTRGSNSLLPPTVRITWARSVGTDFHARFTAQSRRYLYVIDDGEVESAIMAKRLTHTRLKLDIEAMHIAGQHLLGEQDFTAFRAAGCQSRTPFRKVTHLRVLRHHRYIVVDIQANAFLQHMVRNIAGSLMAVGCGEQPPEWIADLLLAGDRTRAAETAPAEGLYLVDVRYPAQFSLPATPPGPLVLPG